MADISSLLSALEVFSGAPDKASLETANTWLQDFQHSSEAWGNCNILLSSQDAPATARLFAAQTFRSKIVYDLHQVDPAHLPALRDTLVKALQAYHEGPRTITTQLSLAIAGLALQFTEWENPVQDMISAFGNNPGTVPVLLQFLAILPEELNNTKIPITDADWDSRYRKLLGSNTKGVVDLLEMYVQASGITTAVQGEILRCLRNWVAASEIKPDQIVNTALFPFVFEALASDQLFDEAVDVVCELIHETQEIDSNMTVVQLIVPRIVALKPMLATDADDPEKIKGYARIFAEAGETYRMLIVEHTESFLPILQAIGECSAYSDLDIVPITFPFWWRLAQIIGKKPSVPPLLLDAYQSLMQVMIRHLHYPSDMSTFTGQEADNFRSFRHVMGDALKDCCYVLRTDTCLLAAHGMLVAALAQGTSWQQIEAPLFALRSMGGQVDPSDEDAVPKIMDLIPQLPNHPRVRYAALLIIARYTEWVNRHPDYLNFQLQYISAGFEDADVEVNGAAGQALRYVCQDCKQHLVDFLPTLHAFLTSTGSKLRQDDKAQVYEAIAYVISAMPMERAGEALRTFAFDILSRISAITNLPSAPTAQQLKDVCDDMESLETMLNVVKGFGQDLPPACQNTCGEAWALLDQLITKFGSSPNVGEKVSRVLRHGISFFGDSALPVAPSVVARMSFAFEATGVPAYLWIAGKLVRQFGNEEGQDIRGSFQEVFERSTNKIVSMLQVKPPEAIPDALEDYIHMLLPLMDFAPEIFFRSTAFPLAFWVCMSALSLIYSDILAASLDLIRDILNHDCLDPPAVPPPFFPQYAAAIKAVIDQEGQSLLIYLLNGVVSGDISEELMPPVVSIFRALAAHWPQEVQAWLTPALQRLPTTTVPNEVKATFVTDIASSIHTQQYDKVKYALLSFRRSCNKARERRGTRVLTS